MDYYFPFLVTGLLPLLSAAMAILTMPNIGPSDTSAKISMLSLLKIPGIVIMSLAMFLTAGTSVMLQPILAPHLKTYGLSISLIGFVFLILPLSSAISTPFIGKLYDALQYKLPVIIFGMFAMGVSCLFLGPSPLLGFKHKHEMLWPILIGLGALGITAVTPTVLVCERIIAYAKLARPNDDPQMLMTVIGSYMWTMPWAGDFTATVLAGTLFDAYGFLWTMTVAAMLCFSAGIMVLVTFTMFGDGEITCGKQKSGEKQALVLRDAIDNNRQ